MSLIARRVLWRLLPTLVAPALLLGMGTPPEATAETFLCLEPRGDGRPPVHYRFTLTEAGWFRSPSLVWDDHGRRLEITALSRDVIKGETAFADYMPAPEQIDRCIDEALARGPGFDRKPVWDWCQRHAALSAKPVPIKLQIEIDPASGKLTVTRAQSKRIARYNIDSYGSCQRLMTQ
jgi:hypothetical protein